MLFSYHLLYFCTALSLIIMLSSHYHHHKSKTFSQLTQCPFTGTLLLLLLQNLFHQGKYARDISLNSHYFILFKNPRDCQQMRYLGTQLGIRKKLMSAYEDATLLPFSYLMIDLSPKCESTYMLRAHIFPFEDTVIYK